ncbi:hypothetical protein [Radiobacillus deserti]|uniref:Spore coat protein n=1 Tax=Radiobacillus deserti TaxID=2594883 RepID=A0A516KE36_9BACI|nr:hypothetical protein [Radiobacillus deserti]QDP39673.1 hypothetical protein FN924_05460 [Radiobacillus deserti]
MLKVIDVGLMSNHLEAHEGVMKRLEMFQKITANTQVQSILSQQIEMMKNHVQVMNQLLQPSETTNHIQVPPIPQPVAIKQMDPTYVGLIEDKYIVMDSHFTATAMANDNFVSASNMKTVQVKQAHIEMGKQQHQIQQMYEMLSKQMGWSHQPEATSMEQQQTIIPLQSSNPQQSNHQGLT